MEFDEVFIDGDVERERLVSTERISDIVGSYASIELYSSEEPRLIVTDDFEALSPREQVLVAMFANELLYRETDRESRFLSTDALFKRFGITYDTHYPYFRKLEIEDIIERRDPRVYALRTEQLSEAVAELQEE